MSYWPHYQQKPPILWLYKGDIIQKLVEPPGDEELESVELGDAWRVRGTDLGGSPWQLRPPHPQPRCSFRQGYTARFIFGARKSRDG
ncbi:unnamed protein product [Nezara viridula]|uniref:Uncharacterized protein n=1 Tax=Nezara viridula TaxID=85310 RepID=A0A9P0HK51_NEZVI|nr:unnamed protein product [Nezara viridula]